uniref:Uncharacterized protein n=1 Tax=Setaria digitata TaxID=48799 RepID=A0A915PW75_9BILA
MFPAGGDVTCSTLSGSPSWIAAKDYCYYWVTLDFSAVLNYGSNNYGKSNNIDHLLKACSKLKDGDKLYGITIERERFPSILGNVSIDLE